MPLSAAAADAHHRKHHPRLTINVISDRADLISGGDALVAIKLPKKVKPSKVRVTLRRKVNGKLHARKLSSAFAVRPDGRFEGLLTGLQLGRSVLQAKVRHRRLGARIAITNHPEGGPVFSGPQVQPWVCKNGSADPQCNAPPTYSYQYMSTSGGMKSYDPKNPPSDVAKTTTDQGETVPYIVRTETGYQDRDQYKIAVLYDPGQGWSPWDAQKGWNHKLLITHGASCGIDHQSGDAPSVSTDTVAVDTGPVNAGSSPTLALSRGFAVMSTALDNSGHNCDVVTQAESLLMAKEHLIETYGPIRYTIGTGCSGGSLAQQQVSNAYPGIYQGILPQCSFPDAWSTGQQLADYHVTRGYLEDPSKWGVGVTWNPASIAAVDGHPNHVNSIILDSLYFTALGDPTNPCAGVSDAERWSPSNPGGVRCTLADYMVNVFGKRADGYAGRPLDNVGVQYGLDALEQGTITPAQFADLNAKVGGVDINAQPQPERVAADEPGLTNAYRSGGINETNNQKDLAIIDLRGPDPGAFHDAYRAFAVRARLDQQNGTHANQVIWEGAAPLIGDTQYTSQALLAMDRWLGAIEKDKRNVPRSQKVIEDKPADIHDQCSDGGGNKISDSLCPDIVQVYETPRMVAGESIATDQNKCQLKPLDRDDYGGVTFTDAEWAQIQQTFPGGVCDWTKPGVDQQGAIPWMTYQDAAGNVIYGGTPLGPAPHSKPIRHRH
jgi:hypothetical protein